MSDFKYTLSGSTSVVGGAYVKNNQVYISNENMDGLDLTDFLSVWVDDTNTKVPADISITVYPLSGDPVTKTFQVNEIEKQSNRMKFSTLEDMDDLFAPVSTVEGTVSLELGLKVSPKERFCGGYEVFAVSKEDNPSCTNSCTFRNTTTGSGFTVSSNES